jgi:hypothetical protein
MQRKLFPGILSNEVPGPMDRLITFLQRLFCTTTGWAMIGCVLGVAAVFIPWVFFFGFATYPGLDEAMRAGGIIPNQYLHLVQGIPGNFHPGRYGFYDGFVTWCGMATGITFFVLLLLLIATSPFDPVPLWRSVVLFGAASLIVLFASLFITKFAYNPLFVIREGAYATLGLGLGLIVLVAIEVRGFVARQLGKPKRPLLVPQGGKDIQDRKKEERFDWEEKSAGKPEQIRSTEDFGPPL